MKADLHVHTSNTDCSNTPREVFQMAKNAGVTVLSITDHDTFYGIEENFALAEEFGIEYIPGIEISAYDYENNKPCHVVGLFVHPGYNPLDKIIESVTKQRHENSLYQVNKLIELDYDISLDDFINRSGIHGIYKQHIMDALINKGYTDEFFGDFYKQMFKEGGPLFRTIDYPCHLEIITLLKESGALAVLAHPTVYGNLASVGKMVSCGLAGIEISYPESTSETSEEIRKIADRYDLFLSGGSDYHGYYAGYNGFVGSHYITDIKDIKERYHNGKAV